MDKYLLRKEVSYWGSGLGARRSLSVSGHLAVSRISTSEHMDWNKTPRAKDSPWYLLWAW